MPRILAADDDDLLRELVRLRLCAAGHQVYSFPDGATALAAVPDVAPDCIVLDMTLAEMSGLAVLSALKADQEFAHVPVIMLTDRKGQDDVLAALRAGAADYLVKPFFPDELSLRIASVLQREGIGAQAWPRGRSAAA